MERRLEVTAQEVARQFGHYSDLALQTPVIVTRHGRARTVMISAAEYERLKRRDRQVLDFATMDRAEAHALADALEAQTLRPTPDLDHEMDDDRP